MPALPRLHCGVALAASRWAGFEVFQAARATRIITHPAPLPVNHPDSHPAQARDFTRLYTNIPHALIQSALTLLCGKCMQFVGETHIAMVYTPANPADTNSNPNADAHFRDGIPPQGASQTGEQTVCNFTADDFALRLECLLAATFIRFGPILVHQICGIPMGISPAPFIAKAAVTRRHVAVT